MCGILAFFGEKKQNDFLNLFERNLKLLFHRGPDNQSVKFLDDNRVLLGHTRLRILDNNPRSNQPFFSSNQRYVIFFNV